MAGKVSLVLEQAYPVYKPRNWGKPTKGRSLPKPWFGLDTERDAQEGKFVCGYIAGETARKFKGITDLDTGTYWVWNLAYDIEGLLRDLDVPEAWAAKTDGGEFELLGGQARYFHNKKFSLKIPGKKLQFIEASSFYNRCALAKIDKKYGEKDTKVKASEMSLSRYEQDMAYRELVDMYCKQDAQIVYNAITDLCNGVKSLGVELGTTPGATARGFLNRLGQFPEILWQTHYHFLKSYCGGRFEITKRGIFDEQVYQYDLVSAYPWALSNCPWLTDSAIMRWTNRYSQNALYGTYEITFNYDHYLGVAPTWRKGIRVYSAGEEKIWLARPEVDWLMRHGARVEFHRALEVFDDNASDLWQGIIAELFTIKNDCQVCFKPWGVAKECCGTQKDDTKIRGAKVLLNSMYGVLIQLIQEHGAWVPLLRAKNPIDFAGRLALEAPAKKLEGGKYYAPLYAGHLTSLVRTRLLDGAIAVGDYAYIGGHTDSVLSRKKLPDWLLSKQLGGWGLEEDAPNCQVAMTGKYAIGNKVKVRGITRAGTPDLLWADSVMRNSRTGIKSASSWDQVSLIKPKMVLNNYAVENKRIWDKPLDAGMIKRKENVDSNPYSWVNQK
jgi:DNA polymerase family B